MPGLMVQKDKLNHLKNQRKRFEALSGKIKGDFTDLLPTNEETDKYCQVVDRFENDPSKDRIWDIVSSKQFLKIYIDGTKPVISESGKLVYRTEDIRFDRKKAMKKSGDLKAKILGMLFDPYIMGYSGNGEVGFSGDVPGEIALFKLDPGESIVAQRNTFLAGIGDIDYSIDIQHSGFGSFLVGEGLFLSRIKNVGDSKSLVFLYSCGGWELLDIKAEHTVIVDSGSVVGWEDTVSHGVEKNNVKRGIFGGEGMFMNKLTGPGKALVQSLTLDKLQLKIGETICLGPMPIMLWQYLQKKVKSLVYSAFRGA